VRQKAPLCPNAKVPDELTQVDCPAKKQNTCPRSQSKPPSEIAGIGSEGLTTKLILAIKIASIPF
jgi:hypothetical protein